MGKRVYTKMLTNKLFLQWDWGNWNVGYSYDAWGIHFFLVGPAIVGYDVSGYADD